MDKKEVVYTHTHTHTHTHTVDYYSAIKKNTFDSALMRSIKLEPIIQSEVSQKKRGLFLLDFTRVAQFVQAKPEVINPKY